MKYMGYFVVIACLGLPLGAAAESGERIQIAVMAMRVDTDLDEGVGRTLNELLLNEFHQFRQLKVLGSSDIEAMLKHEEQKSLLVGCSEDTCMVEIGGALGVGKVAVPSLGAVGSHYVVNIKLLDVSRGSVIGRVSETVPRQEDELFSAFKRAVTKVVRASLPEGAVAEVRASGQDGGAGAEGGTSEVSAQASPPVTFARVAPWVSLGLAVAAAGAGGAMAGLASKDADAATELVHGTAAWQDKRDAAQGKALGADVLFGVAGAAALTTVILFLVLDDDEAAATVSVGPAPGGAAAACTVRF